jgi:amino acid adenylation domain-containing protein
LKSESIAERKELSEAKRRLLAQRLKGLSGSHQDSQRIQPRPAGVKTPISADQYRIWLHASTQPDLPTYNEPITIQYQGNLDLDRLETSFNRFLQRHEAWRTSFSVHQEEVLQVIHPDLHIKLERVDLSDLPEMQREVEAKRLATEQAIRPISLTDAPLFRVLVVQLAADDHRLHLVLHHIIFDGISLQRTFIPELAAIYAGLESGIEPALAERTLQYCDYALWRQQEIDSAAIKTHIDDWKNLLAGELPTLRLPSDRPRPAVISQRGGMERFFVPRELTLSLRELSQAHGVTLYMLMLAAFKVLLFRYSGQEDIIVGSAADGRRRPELQGMVGYILDTFAVRTRPSSKLSFSSYLGEVKSAVLAALDASDVPFDRVVQAVGIKRDLTHHPIFQTFFSFQPEGGDFPAGWDMTPMDITVGAAKFDIYFEVDERQSHTAARIIYSTDLFDADTIRRMSGHWLTLLEAIRSTPDCCLADLPLLSPEELDLMLIKWNNQARPLPATTVHGLVEDQVRRTPDKLAVQFADTSWSYSQLNRQAEMFATHLRCAGAGPNTLVAICIDRSENLIAGLLGILKTGAAYLPLDPGTPRDRILLCLEDAAPVVVLTQRSLAGSLPSGNASILVLEDLLESGTVANAPPETAASSAGPDDLAYVIHTSGSTGRPKGVELRHRSVVNLLLSMQSEPGFTASDSLLAVTTVSFDIAVLELFLPLISGGRVVIASRNAALDPWQLAALIRSNACTVMQATPATWSALLDSDWKGQPGLRVLCGGEAFPRGLADRLLALDLEVWNVYGPTETTIWSTVRRVSSVAGPVPIGRPIANTTTYILDTNQQPVPVGVPGVLYIGGLGLAKGYRGQADLTAQKFVTPAIAKGERLYNTGDFALYRSDGTIECQGRSDNQVKIRGYRIELEDVEFHLTLHPRVAAAAAKVWPDISGGYRLSAYLVGRNGPPPDGAELRAFLQSRLPDYMIPSDTVSLQAMPLTANGKLDRKALLPPNPSMSRGVPDLPVTEEEERLARIWADVLGVDCISRSDNFFDLGGHSLLLVRLFARINKEFQSSLPITAIFDTKTLSGLAKALRREVRISSLVPVQTSGSKPPLFMVHSYLLYRALSRALGNDQPFYGLRELPGDGSQSIEDRAARYVADMRRVQQQGPYRIAGWCAAGPLAVEVARQILLAGDEVALVVLFDSWLPGYTEQLRSMQSRLSYLRLMTRRLGAHIGKIRGLPPKAALTYLWDLVSRTVRTTRDRLYIRYSKTITALHERLNFPLPHFMHNTTLETFASIRGFREESIPVRLTLIRAIDSPEVPGASESHGWEKIAGLGVRVLSAIGDHETMFRGNNLNATAALVNRTLSECMASWTLRKRPSGNQLTDP